MEYTAGSLSLFLNPELPLPEDLQDVRRASAPANSHPAKRKRKGSASPEASDDESMPDNHAQTKRSKGVAPTTLADGAEDQAADDSSLNPPGDDAKTVKPRAERYDPANDPRLPRTIFVGNVALSTTRKVCVWRL